MSTYKKIALVFGIIILLVVGIIVGRIVLNNVIQKKINQVNPTEVVAINVKKSEFYEKILNGSKGCLDEKTIQFKEKSNPFKIVSFEEHKTQNKTKN